MYNLSKPLRPKHKIFSKPLRLLSVICFSFSCFIGSVLHVLYVHVM